MSSLASLVTERPLMIGQDGPAIMALQIALHQAGYRIGTDGDFGPGTELAVQRFQRQHGLKSDGIVGALTASLLDAPHEALVITAKPEISATGFPHDDTASLMAFYGKPWLDASLIVHVICPFPITYGGKPVTSIPFHRQAAPALTEALAKIAEAAKVDESILHHVKHWSGSGNYRAVRGSSRLSTHAFWAANDFDAEHLPLGHGIVPSEFPEVVADIFISTGAFWGNNYKGRKDPMHFQYAHE